MCRSVMGSSSQKFCFPTHPLFSYYYICFQFTVRCLISKLDSPVHCQIYISLSHLSRPVRRKIDYSRGPSKLPSCRSPRPDNGKESVEKQSRRNQSQTTSHAEPAGRKKASLHPSLMRQHSAEKEGSSKMEANLAIDTNQMEAHTGKKISYIFWYPASWKLSAPSTVDWSWVPPLGISIGHVTESLYSFVFSLFQLQ